MMYVIFILGLIASVVGILLFVKKANKKIAFGVMIGGVVLMFASAPSIETDDAVNPKPATTQVKEEPKELSLEEKVENTVNDELGKNTNTKKDRIHKVEVYNDVVNVWINSDENLTAKLAKKGMWRDTFDALEKLADYQEVALYQFVWMATFVDKNGNESEGKIMSLDFPREVIDQINFEKVDYNNAPNISENYWEHTSLK